MPPCGRERKLGADALEARFILRQRVEPDIGAPLVHAVGVLQLVRTPLAVRAAALRAIALGPPVLARHAVMEIGIVAGSVPTPTAS